MKKLMAGALVAALLVSQTGIADMFVKTDATTVSAAEQDAEFGVGAAGTVEIQNIEGRMISAFVELPEEIREQSVPVGTSLEELELPDTLEAVCVEMGLESAPDEDEPGGGRKY